MLTSQSSKKKLTIILNNILLECNLTIPRTNYQSEVETCTMSVNLQSFQKFNVQYFKLI